MLQDPEQLVDGARAERVAHLGAVEGDPDGAVLDRAVVGQVGEVVEARDLPPRGRVEDLRDTVVCHERRLPGQPPASYASCRVEPLADRGRMEV